GVDDLALKLDAGLLELLPCLLDIRNAKRDRPCIRLRLELGAHRLGRYKCQREVPGLVFDPPRGGTRAPLQSERLSVESVRASEVAYGNGDEVNPLDLDQPTDPSICIWISRFISTAYSSGSSFVIGSTNPEPNIGAASGSARPRLMR